jgi:hypothetical protein
MDHSKRKNRFNSIFHSLAKLVMFYYVPSLERAGSVFPQAMQAHVGVSAAASGR